MSGITYAFEHDKTSIFLRNQFMHVHFRKLDHIKHRNNTFLPLITTIPKKTEGSPSKFPTYTIAQKYVMNRDNKILYRKLNSVMNRESQLVKDEGQINKYLEMKRGTRENVRKIKRKILSKSNEDIQMRIKGTKPVINRGKIKNDFNLSRVYFKNLQKVKPNQSVCELFLTKNESKIIDNYTNEILLTKNKNRNRSMTNFNMKGEGNNYSEKRNNSRNTIDKKLLTKIGYTLKENKNKRRCNSQI